MVKKLDENLDFLLDHVGWRLWRANRAWQVRFASEMRAAGHTWFTDARATLIGHISRAGTRQISLVERLGITKQAVQQLIDGLEEEGVLERFADPADGRGRMVRFTEKGLAALEEGDGIKFRIERTYVAKLGRERFGVLMEALQAIDGSSSTDRS